MNPMKQQLENSLSHLSLSPERRGAILSRAGERRPRRFSRAMLLAIGLAGLLGITALADGVILRGGVTNFLNSGWMNYAEYAQKQQEIHQQLWGGSQSLIEEAPSWWGDPEEARYTTAVVLEPTPWNITPEQEAAIRQRVREARDGEDSGDGKSAHYTQPDLHAVKEELGLAYLQYPGLELKRPVDLYVTTIHPSATAFYVLYDQESKLWINFHTVSKKLPSPYLLEIVDDTESQNYLLLSEGLGVEAEVFISPSVTADDEPDWMCQAYFTQDEIGYDLYFHCPLEEDPVEYTLSLLNRLEPTE